MQRVNDLLLLGHLAVPQPDQVLEGHIVLSMSVAGPLVGVLRLRKLQVQCQSKLVKLFLQNVILLFQLGVIFLPGTAWVRNFGLTSVLNRTHV